MKKAWWLAVLLGMGCNPAYSEDAPSDWLVVQQRADGTPSHCWALRHTNVVLGYGGTWVSWPTPGGNTVYVTNPLIRVQIRHGSWSEAYSDLGITQEVCTAVSQTRSTMPTTP